MSRLTMSARAEAIELGKSRSDCAAQNIDSLVSLLEGLDEAGIRGDVAEVGGYRCGATIAMSTVSPFRAIYAFDVFGGLPYGEGRGFENFADADYFEVLGATEKWPNIVTVRGLHEETLPGFKQPLALIFLDSDHYSSHAVCLKHLWPQLAEGGLLVLHDPTFEGVQRALREADLLDRLADVPRSPNMKMVVKVRA